ncbi:MAG: acyl-CoA dehydrogenase [Novosphingobium lindaniclasticum]|jgi:alkylation response protein AidB-like acyl-CoA dehydrogenase|uniref:acyl-CoA dehydrogenase family protein n=1 Tax=Novosphingobium lindaniclasticum TaxID=1329895 RepID=UPI002409440C|nr:acyl-CoA dehydrogenase family protein [Novosphingobium lindaniclasticum]MDF2638457.1 acyl-CoA dehydrogenase [Novosphingobium lindaniclasticum]
MNYAQHADALVRHLAIMPFRDRLAQIAPEAVDPDIEVSVIEQAAQFTEGSLESVAGMLDRLGVTVVDGRATTSVTQIDAWRAFCEMGWLSMVAPEPYGQGLSLALLTACEEIFNRASAPFCMLATSTRTAASLLTSCGSQSVIDEWVPRLLSGEWSATICISEPDAGSDVGRIRTQAKCGEGGWHVTGEKCWISYGDHDLTSRIGHLALARSTDSVGVRGLSLFLVPSTREDGSANAVHLRRVEEKLGLHCSPTCQIGFEESEAVLLGQEGRGLQTLFQMMLLMRLNCGPQGMGVASAAFATALGYAQDRKQGGPADKPPVSIVEHTDVQRQLLEMAAVVELGRGLNFAAANALDLGARCPDPEEARRWTDLAQFLLPLVKDGAARAAFDVSSAAVQVLGGAGYTCEWPVERYLRDARVFSVFEGTTGMQALDILHRRVWRDNRAGIDAFVAAIADDSRDCSALVDAIGSLNAASDALCDLVTTPQEGEAGAFAFLELCRSVAYGWIAARIVKLSGDDPAGRRMSAAADYYLAGLPTRARAFAEEATLGAQRLAGFAAYLEH